MGYLAGEGRAAFDFCCALSGLSSFLIVNSSFVCPSCVCSWLRGLGAVPCLRLAALPNAPSTLLWSSP